jgi:hypothetical protein
MLCKILVYIYNYNNFNIKYISFIINTILNTNKYLIYLNIKRKVMKYKIYRKIDSQIPTKLHISS